MVVLGPQGHQHPAYQGAPPKEDGPVLDHGQRAYTLEGGDETSSKDVIKLPGCTLSLWKGARVPEGLAEVRRSRQVDLERFRCAPAAAGMVMESKVMSRWYDVASV